MWKMIYIKGLRLVSILSDTFSEVHLISQSEFGDLLELDGKYRPLFG